MSTFQSNVKDGFNYLVQLYERDQQLKNENIAVENQRRYLELIEARQDETLRENAKIVTAEDAKSFLESRSATGLSNGVMLALAGVLTAVLILK